MRDVKVGSLVIGRKRPLVFIMGPCVIESRSHTLFMAEELKKIALAKKIPLIFKASYDKANRSSGTSFRGPGIEEGLKILEEVKKTFSLPVISDVHFPEEIQSAKEVLDLIQIPAFLCRQTDLILEAAKSKRPLHIKKGQFVAPWDMRNVVEKALSQGNEEVILCERGASFGYNNLVSDMRSLHIMQTFQVPVSFDASHSVQLPGSQGKETGGDREYIPLLARAAVATGIQALFLETHNNPLEAKSDRAVVFPLQKLGSLIDSLLPIHEIASSCLEDV